MKDLIIILVLVERDDHIWVNQYFNELHDDIWCFQSFFVNLFKHFKSHLIAFWPPILDLITSRVRTSDIDSFPFKVELDLYRVKLYACKHHNGLLLFSFHLVEEVMGLVAWSLRILNQFIKLQEVCLALWEVFSF